MIESYEKELLDTVYLTENELVTIIKLLSENCSNKMEDTIIYLEEKLYWFRQTRG